MAEGLLPTDKVWVPDLDRVWTVAEVIGFDENTNKLEIAVAVNGRYETRSIDKNLTLSWDKDHDEDFRNAFKMSDLNEAALLGLLERRSRKDQIYTFTGDILLSVNPYKNIQGLYEPMPSVEALKDYDPHLYVLAAKVYEDLFNTGLNGTSQAILINGESGAGKTEAAKRIMAFLMELSKRKRDANRKKKKQGRGGYGYGGGRMPKRGKPMQATANAKKVRGSIMRFKDGVQDKIQKMRGSTKRPKDDIIPVNRTQSAIEKIILRTNPLLEAFGNARTIRNDNSSRFGKFVQMEYDKEEIIKGAQTKHFLLEKSRVTSHGRGERNYHIFYQMCAAFQAAPENPAFSEVKMLKSFDHYKYLMPTAAVATEVSVAKRPRMMTKKPKANSRDGVGKMAQRAVDYLETHKDEITRKDTEIFQLETSVALQQINLEVEDQKNIWKVLAAILHLGNLEIERTQKVEAHGQIVDVVKVVVDEVKVDGEKKSNLDICAQLLGVEAHLLANALTMKTITVGSKRSVTTKPLTLEEARESKDGLAKAIYEALFEWMLKKVNMATGSVMEKAVAAAPFGINQKRKPKAKKASKPVFIGILDIFGFEMLEDNSFEQLCINYANEALQGMFDRHVFELEKEAYQEENIDVDQLNLEFRDNIPLLELLNKRGTGIFQLMDEQAARANGSDKVFFRSIQEVHSLKQGDIKKKHTVQRFAGVVEDTKGRFYFRINHFAGIVQYTVNGMVEKNSDHLQADLADLIAVGGMPVEAPELTPEEEKQLEMDHRMNKRKLSKRKSVDKADGKNTGHAASLNAGQNSNSFSFLQMILKLRSDKAKGPLEEELAQDAEDKKPKKARRGRRDRQKKMAALQSLSSRFRKEMTSLQKLLDTTEQHFVRCIKPNDLKVPPTERWDHHMVNAQLRMLGALEMVRVRRMGFPIRTLFEEFLPKFPELCTKHKITFEKGIEDRKACVAFMHQIDDTGKNKRWHLGDTKLFLQESTFKQLNDEERTIRDAKVEKEEKLRRLQEQQARMEKEHNASIVVQKMMRMYYFRNRFLKGKKGIIKLQAIARGLKHKREFAKTVKMVILIQKIARGFIIRKRYGKLSKVALLLNPVAKGFLLRKKTNRIMELRNRYKKSLQPGECVVLESLCQADQGKRLDATLTKSYSLLLTTGPFPRILYANSLTGVLHTELSWDDRVLCGLMANEHKLVLYSKPLFKDASKSKLHDDSDQKLYKFEFIQPVAAIWLLALKEIFSVHDVLNMRTPDYAKIEAENPGCTKKMVEEHGNMQPLNLKTNKGFLFGGDSVFGGSQNVLRKEPAKLTQTKEWRNRYFVLKECTLFWFRPDDEPGQAFFPIGGLNLSTETTIEMASTDSRFFTKNMKQKASLQIESRLLRQSLKVNFSSGKIRQNWVTKMRNAIKSRVKANETKRLSISKGILDTKGFLKINAEELLSPSTDEHDLDADSGDLRLEDEDAVEDIEQGIGDELLEIF